MNKMKEEETFKNYLGEERVKKLGVLQIEVDKTKAAIDNEAYNDMLKLLIKYCMSKPNYYYTYYSFRDVLRKYYDLSYKLITKIANYNNKEIYDIYKFINNYTENNLNYKLSIINEFINLGVIEERSYFEFNTYDLYKKLLQVLSVKYKKGYKKSSKDVYNSSRLNNIQTKGKRISKKIVQLNNKSNLVIQEPIFKPTVTTMDIVCNLPDLIADNEEKFKELINYLYKMFWENKIKDYSKNGELDFINNLRRYFFHDLEHDRDSKTKKKIKLVKDFYEDALGKNFPETAKDWQIVQEYIYNLLLKFLENIEIKESDLV